MKELKNKIIYSAIGASSGLTGFLSLSRCPNNTCLSCYGCVSLGIGIILFAIIKKLGGKKKDNGLA